MRPALLAVRPITMRPIAMRPDRTVVFVVWPLAL
jgi:hypothetical protein